MGGAIAHRLGGGSRGFGCRIGFGQGVLGWGEVVVGCQGKQNSGPQHQRQGKCDALQPGEEFGNSEECDKTDEPEAHGWGETGSTGRIA